MKINGESLTVKNQSVVILSRGDKEYPLTVSPLPAGWSEMARVRGFGNFPSAPKKPVEVKGVIQRDQATKKAIYEDDFNDPKYREEVAKISLRYDVVCLAEMLRHDSSIQFDAVRPTTDDPKEWLAYGDKLCLEVCDREQGFTDKEIEKITEVGKSLECRINVEAAVDGFLPETQ